jgi:hypothetical protein
MMSGDPLARAASRNFPAMLYPDRKKQMLL